MKENNGVPLDTAVPPELRAVLDHLPSGLSIHRLEGGRFTQVYCNPAFYRVMGYSQAHIGQIQGGSAFLGVHPEDRPGLLEETAALVRRGGELTRAFRVFHDRLGAYRWIRLEGKSQRLADGSAALYGIYTDIHGEKQMEAELTAANAKMQDIINAIPGGVAIYKVTDIFETVYFSNGVPELTGYTVEEYRELIRGDAALMTYPQDREQVVETVRRALQEHTVAELAFRKLHRDGHIVWVRAQARQVGEKDGAPLVQCVFHNITDLEETQLEMNHLVNSIPGGVASYRVKDGRFFPVFYSDGVPTLAGYTREAFEAAGGDLLSLIYRGDRERVDRAVREALRTGGALQMSCRIRHRDQGLIWIHLSGRRIGPLTETAKFYTSFTGMSEESRMYQELAGDTADSVYVIDRSSYELLYFHESKHAASGGRSRIGDKCYAALHGQTAPCAFCNLSCKAPGEDAEVVSPRDGRVYSLCFQEMAWNGIPAYVQRLRDITEEVETRREKERLEQYFQTLVESLPGGVAVVHRQADGRFVPEYLSAGFAAMTGLTVEEAWALYQRDAMAGVHPEDVPGILRQLEEAMAHVGCRCEMTYRLKNGRGGYLWVRSILSILPGEGGTQRQYMFLRDITQEREEREHVREQYRQTLLQHYRASGPNTLLVGHCNITQNVIMELVDYTAPRCTEGFSLEREAFFTALSGLVVRPEDRRRFLETYLNEPLLDAYRRKENERVLTCLIQIPGEDTGRYAECRVNLVAEPDTGDITGILTVTDITEKRISDQVLHRLSDSGYDHIVLLDLIHDRYTVFASNDRASGLLPEGGSHSGRVAYMLEHQVVPKDRERYRQYLDASYVTARLAREGSYTFDISILDGGGGVRVKRMTVFSIDRRLGRVCLARTDVTDSAREQQGLLNMLAYTFELVAFIEVGTNRMVMYTRQTVLEDLSPYTVEDFDGKIAAAAAFYGRTEEERLEMRRRLTLQSMLEELERSPGGYDFVCPYRTEEGLRYKKVSILWGDRNRQTVCMVRADVTEMLAEERKNKEKLESALFLAEAASRAKSEFLSSMSHDIRTPMNAIMGMTTLAGTRPEDPAYVKECLGKIAVSSKHLLDLINDVLDMSKIEQSKIELNRERLSLRDIVEQVATMIRSQAEEKGQRFCVELDAVTHDGFYGDALRINQILINILGNAVKFTPRGGQVSFRAEERPAALPDRARYRFTIRDTGVGMSREVLSHVFEPFTRDRRVGRVEGTGLGLSITKGLVDRDVIPDASLPEKPRLMV
uniref:PAS domain-containing protein n=1 Tax=uncultured Oscillibacter sp. TaxID=876091 RepID=UPI0025E31944